ncbi:MAG: hypothetical protein J6Z01_10435 [Bacteroidales bacterium]|nr:hypothetical protein [Bacteroidales bacterium]
MKNIRIIITLTFALFASTASAQFEDFEDEEKATVKVTNNGVKEERGFLDKFAFGGSFGFGFTSDFGYIETVPFFGYRFNDYVTAGATATYMYSYYSDPYARIDDFDSHIFGGGVFADVYPFKFLVIHAEAQALSFENYSDGYTINLDAERMWDMPVILGVGYHQSFTDRIGVNYLIMWNFNDTKELKYNVYNPLIMRISFVF